MRESAASRQPSAASKRDTPFHQNPPAGGGHGRVPTSDQTPVAAVRHPENMKAPGEPEASGRRAGSQPSVPSEAETLGLPVPGCPEHPGASSAESIPSLAYHSSAADPQPATGQSSTTIQDRRPVASVARLGRRGACRHQDAGRMKAHPVDDSRATVRMQLVEVAATPAHQVRFDAALRRAALVISRDGGHGDPPHQSREPLPPIAGDGTSPPSPVSTASQPSESVQAGGSDTPSPPSAAPNQESQAGSLRHESQAGRPRHREHDAT